MNPSTGSGFILSDGGNKNKESKDEVTRRSNREILQTNYSA